MFVFRASVMMEQFRRLMPDTYRGLCDIGAAIGSAAFEEELIRLFPTLEKISIDFGTPDVASYSSGQAWPDTSSRVAIHRSSMTTCPGVSVTR